jgi:hypothetical protein
MKRCPKCGLDLPETEFHRARDRPSGLSSFCRTCQLVSSRKSRRPGGGGHARHRESKWAQAPNSPGIAPGIRFGGAPLTYAAWEQIKAVTGGRCALCGRDEIWGNLHADHDKRTGEVRGALCGECNHRAVGTFERYGHYGSEEMESAIRAYISDPPAARLRARIAGSGVFTSDDL